MDLGGHKEDFRGTGNVLILGLGAAFWQPPYIHFHRAVHLRFVSFTSKRCELLHILNVRYTQGKKKGSPTGKVLPSSPQRLPGWEQLVSSSVKVSPGDDSAGGGGGGGVLPTPPI